MSISYPKVLDEFRKMRDIELNYAKTIDSEIEKIENPTIKALLEIVARDSEKHAKLFEHLVEAITNPMNITDKEQEYILNTINKHINMEKTMIKFIEDHIDKFEEPRVKMLLAAIYNDEVNHHKLLTTLKEKLKIKQETGEEAYWRAVMENTTWIEILYRYRGRMV